MKLADLLDQIDRLDQEATKGPWIIDSIESGEHALFVDEDNPGYGHLGAASSTVASFLLAENANFIANARESLPKLAAVIRRLRECAQTLTEDNNDASDYASGIHEAVECFEHIITDALGDDDA